MRHTNRNSAILLAVLTLAAVALSFFTPPFYPAEFDVVRETPAAVDPSNAGDDPISPAIAHPFSAACVFDGSVRHVSFLPVPALDEFAARKIIEDVFAAEGFALQPNYVYREEGVAFTANGYDPARRVGYWLSTNDDRVAQLSGSERRYTWLSRLPNNEYFKRSPHYNILCRQLNERHMPPDRAHLDMVFRAILDELDPLFISREETHQLAIREPRTGVHFAFIELWDERIWYPTTEEVTVWADQCVAAAQRINTAQADGHDDDARAAEAEHKSLWESRKPPTDPAVRLAKLSRDYIRWARRQGAK